MENNRKSKNIEVISGDGNDLDISPVSNHIPISKPKIQNNDKKIVIPTEKKKRKKSNQM